MFSVFVDSFFASRFYSYVFRLKFVKFEAQHGDVEHCQMALAAAADFLSSDVCSSFFIFFQKQNKVPLLLFDLRLKFLFTRQILHKLERKTQLMKGTTAFETGCWLFPKTRFSLALKIGKDSVPSKNRWF